MTYKAVDAASENVLMGWTASTHDNRGGQQLNVLGHLTLENLQLVLSELGCHDLHPDGSWWWSINLSTQHIIVPPTSQLNTHHTTTQYCIPYHENYNKPSTYKSHNWLTSYPSTCISLSLDNLCIACTYEFDFYLSFTSSPYPVSWRSWWGRK